MPTILDRFDYWVKTNPSKLLYSFLNIKGEVIERYTYAEFDRRTKIFAGYLLNNYNFERNDRVLLAFPPGVELICAFFACVRNGLVPVPTYPPTSSGFTSAYYKMVYIAEDCKASAVLTSDEYYWNLKFNLEKNKIEQNNILANIPWINTGECDNATPLESRQDKSDFLFLQYTSGSTSRPKGVMVSHENLLCNANHAVDHLPIGVSWLPQYHDMGLIGYYLFFAIKGGTTYGFAPSDFIRKPSLWFETITKYNATASSAPNFAYEYCLKPGKITEEALDKIDLSSLRYLMTAAEPVRPKTYEKFISFFKPYGLDPENYFAAYGLAENTLAVSNYGKSSILVSSEYLKRNILYPLSPDSELESKQIMSCGVPFEDQEVKIVDPDTHIELGNESIGEIWINGPSTCLGYWNKPALNKEIFEASILNSGKPSKKKYLRTGDLGFIYNGELFICGRVKDMIIIRGMNYYPHDIEKIVAEASSRIRAGFVAAFSAEIDNEEKLIVVAGVKGKNNTPDSPSIDKNIRSTMNIQPYNISYVHAKNIPRTSSGKIKRNKTKNMWLNNELDVIEEYTPPAGSIPEDQNQSSFFDDIKQKYDLSGNEDYALVEVLDSIDLYCMIHDTKELLVKNGAANLSKDIDYRLLQEINVCDFFSIIEEMQSSSYFALEKLRKIISKLQKEHKKYELKLMKKDSKLNFTPGKLEYDPQLLDTGNILVTGGTGFLGPFLVKSILEQTTDKIYVLVRSENPEKALDKLIESFKLAGIYGQTEKYIEAGRVEPVCGDLSVNQLGLGRETWDFLANNIHTIYHNGAMVNYLFNYERMRDANVSGTNEILRLAFDGIPKIMNYTSTTFVFGWAVKDTLYETDFCESLDLLDFGYSQTKWVAEQLVVEGMKQGLKARIFRPALITPSVNGNGNNFDISIRLLAFIIKHNISVNTHNQVSFTPADLSANNIVAISNLPETINKSFHVTRDEYSSMMDITDIITDLTGETFNKFNLKEFVPEVISRCSKNDLLFPLLDFLVQSVDNISSMEFKLYDNQNYCKAKRKSKFGMEDPSLEDTVKGILLFMEKKGIIDVEFPR